MTGPRALSIDSIRLQSLQPGLWSRGTMIDLWTNKLAQLTLDIYILGGMSDSSSNWLLDSMLIDLGYPARYMITLLTRGMELRRSIPWADYWIVRQDLGDMTSIIWLSRCWFTYTYFVSTCFYEVHVKKVMGNLKPLTRQWSRINSWSPLQ